MKDTTGIHIRLDNKYIEKLKILTDKYGVSSFQQIVRMAVKSFLDKEFFSEDDR